MICNLRINLKSDSQFFSENQKTANHFSFLKSSPARVHTHTHTHTHIYQWYERKCGENNFIYVLNNSVEKNKFNKIFAEKIKKYVDIVGRVG